jgi:hypothetical protein
MSRTLWTWLFGAADDTAQAGLMLVFAGAVVSLAERGRPPESEAPGPSSLRTRGPQRRSAR